MNKHTLDHNFDHKKSRNNKLNESFPFGKLETDLICNGLKVNGFRFASKGTSTKKSKRW